MDNTPILKIKSQVCVAFLEINLFVRGKLQNVGQFGHVEIKIITEKRHGNHFCKSIGNKPVVEGVFNHYINYNALLM